jgi:tetratricopeptide (TPR) repeat protein
MNVTRSLVPFATACIGILVAACHQDPATAAGEFVARADRYVAAGNIEAGVLEYRNAVARMPASADVHYKLALAYEKLLDSDKAMREFVQVTQLDARNVDADLRVATMFLAAGRVEDAERLANRVLIDNPTNVRALSLAAGALESHGQIVPAARRVSEALAVDPHASSALVARASLERRRGDRAKARDTLHEALKYDPTAFEAWAALGTVEEESGNVASATAALEKAFALNRDKTAMRRLLAAFYVRTGRAALAEPHLQALSENNGVDRLALADYYLAQKKGELAEPLLDALVRDKQMAAEARLRRAALAALRGRLADAAAELAPAIADPRTEVRGRLARSELLLYQGKQDEALNEAQRAAAQQPDAAYVNYAVGVIQRLRGDYGEAEPALQRARAAAPRAVAIEYELVLVSLGRGDAARAVEIAEHVVSSSPSSATYALLARALRARGDLKRAREVLGTASARWPEASELDVERGYAELAVNRPAMARQAFERAVRRAPKSFGARSGLVIASVAAGQGANARLSLDRWRATAPDDVQIGVLSARLDFTEGKRERAEQTLLDLIRRMPNDADAADALAQFYLATGNRDEALRYYERAAQSRSNPVGELTMVGMLKAAAADTAGAKQAYERVLTINANAGIAANNLAWLLADEGHIEDALSTARLAAMALPDLPQALDTLGWMSHLAGNTGDAIRYLSAARDKSPNNPVYLYHIGTVYLRAGRTSDGRAALRKALDISPSFNGAREAQRLLASSAQ